MTEAGTALPGAVDPETVERRSAPSAVERLGLIQIFRGLAATLVVLYHASTVGGSHLHVQFLNDLFHFGHCGVDFFFVLSGFIILHAHYDQNGDWKRAPSYLVARAIRIFPIYWIMLMLYLAFYAIAPETTHPRVFEAETIKRAIVLYDQSSVAVVPVAWTLTYELVFYMFFTIYILAGRAPFALMTIGWGALILAQWAGMVHLPHPVVLRPIVLQFLAGCLAAAVVKRLPPARTAHWVILAGIVFVVVGMAENEQFLNDLETLRNWTAPCFLLIVAAACYDKAQPRHYPRTLLLLGEASYVIYLLHYLLLQALIKLHEVHPWPTHPRLPLVVFVIVTLWAGCLIYRYVDLPLRSYLRRHLLHLPSPDKPMVP